MSSTDKSIRLAVCMSTYQSSRVHLGPVWVMTGVLISATLLNCPNELSALK